MSATTIRVAEIFGPTIQGEGALIGLPTVFVRTGGCDFRCSWCDSMHAVDPKYRAEWKSMTPGTIVESVLGLTGGRPILVTLSGGNPALQPLGELLDEGRKAGLGFAMETQGSRARLWMAKLDHLVLSPKPPSSGMDCDRGELEQCLAIGLRAKVRTSLKVVVFDVVDLDWALELHSAYPRVACSLQVGNADVTPPDDDDPLYDPDLHRGLLLDRLTWLADALIERRVFDIRVLPQLHTLMWGNARAR